MMTCLFRMGLAWCVVLLLGACSDDSNPVPDTGVRDSQADGLASDGSASDGSAADSLAVDAGSDVSATDGAADGPAVDQGVDQVVVDTGVDQAVDTAIDQTVADAATPDAKVMCGRIRCDCTLNGKNLWGKVKYVTFHPDFKIKQVEHVGDLKVQTVSFNPNSCGKWQEVTFGEDFTVQKVTFGEDFQVRYVEYLPGVVQF